LECGGKNYNQWLCPESRPKAPVASAQITTSVQPQKREWGDLDIKEESAPPETKQKAAAIISMGRRICELKSESMDIDD
jgi:hypothetical protein